MSRNAESHFSTNPTNIDIQRSTFKRDHGYKTSFNCGDLIPFYIEEVLPGDTHKINTNKVVRMSTLIAPIMDNIYLDTYYFFVPNRLVWEHWREMNGENNSSPWTQTIEYEVPQLTAPSDGWEVGTIADYFGIPTGISNISVNAMPFRAYALICNDWFRDENLCNPLSFNKDDATVSGSNGDNPTIDCAKGGKPYVVAKYADYFTSSLPAPQKGQDVLLPLGTQAPVYAGDDNPSPQNLRYLRFQHIDGSDFVSGNGNIGYWSNGGQYASAIATNSSPGTSTGGIAPINLYADLNMATGSSVNALRMAFQIQRLYEKDARGGTRYVELIKSHFGVTSPDSRMQRPEYLGGTRVPITINQVIQQSETNNTPQGNTSAYSLTVDSNHDFVHSFTEHGFIIGVCCARYHHSYQQGLDRMWSRKDRFDYYWPVLANIGEQSVKLKEIYCTGTSDDDTVFGYQEAWAEYRYKPNKITGMLRSTYAQSLDLWHLGDNYNTAPNLSEGWIREDKNIVDRTLAVSSSISHQFIADFFIEDTATRAMPLYSIPGLIDHH